MDGIDLNSSEDLTRAVKEKAISLGAHLVGVAPMERMENAPQDLHPKRLLPEAKSLISMAFRINRGVQQLHLRGTSPMPFSRFAGLEPKVRLDEMALDLANFLEDLDFISLPVPANQYYYQEKGVGEISHKHVAMAAGLGRLGRGGVPRDSPVRRRGAVDHHFDYSPSFARSHSWKRPMSRVPPALRLDLSRAGHPKGP
jgi:epoxyqueuosine reductase QueG